MDNSEKIDKLYQRAIEIRNFEIQLFWKRSNYFLILNIAIATGVFIKVDDNSIKLALIILGILSSIFWICINFGSKFWQDRWENKLAEIESIHYSNDKLFNTTLDETKNDVLNSFNYNSPKKCYILKRLTNYLIIKNLRFLGQ